MVEPVSAFIHAASNALNVFGSLGASNSGMANSYDYQKKLMQDQAAINYKYYSKELQNRWRLAREGLNNGNFNPMLAAIGSITGNSAWASPQSISDANFGSTSNGAVSNANVQRDLDQQEGLRLAQTANYNADSLTKNADAGLKIMQTATEEARQDLYFAQAQLTKAETAYKNKEITYYEYKVAQDDYKNATERLNVILQHKDRVTQSSIYAAETNNNALMINSNMNVNNATEKEKEQITKRMEWENKHPYKSRILAPFAGGLSVGVGSGVGTHIQNINFKSKRPVGFRH